MMKRSLIRMDYLQYEAGRIQYSSWRTVVMI